MSRAHGANRASAALRGDLAARTLRSAGGCGSDSFGLSALRDVTWRDRCRGAAAAAAVDGSASLRAAAALHPLCPAALRRTLRSDPNSAVRAAVSDPCAVARDEQPLIRNVAAASSSCPLALMIRLAEDPDNEVRGNVAGNPAAPAALLALLAHDADSFVRFEAAGNPSTPLAALLALASDKTLSTRAHLAANPSIPPAAIEALTVVPGNPVCEGLASNPASSVELLARLAGRDCLHDSHAKSCDCRFDGEAFGVVLAGVLDNPSTPERLAAEIVADTAALWSDDPGACSALAAVDADPESQRRWAQHPDSQVRAGLARNRRLEATAAATLAADKDNHVLYDLLANPACPAQILDAHLDNEYEARTVAANTNCPERTLRELASSPSADIRSGAAANPACPPDALVEMASHHSAALREAALRNPNCPRAALTAAAVTESQQYVCPPSLAALASATFR